MTCLDVECQTCMVLVLVLETYACLGCVRSQLLAAMLKPQDRGSGELRYHMMFQVNGFHLHGSWSAYDLEVPLLGVR